MLTPRLPASALDRHSLSRCLAVLIFALCAVLSPTLLPAQKGAGPDDFAALEARIDAEAKLAPAQRVAAIQALGRFKSAAARRFALSLLKSEKHAQTRRAVLSVLRRHDHASVASAVRGVFKNVKEDRAVRGAAADILVRSGAPGIKLMRSALRSKDDVTWRLAASALSRSRRVEALTALFQATKKASGEKQANLAFELRGNELTDAMVSWLARTARDDGKPLRLRAECARQLAFVKPGDALKAALSIAGYDDTMKNVLARSATLAAIVVAFRPKYIEIALDLAADDAPRVDWELRILGEERTQAFTATLVEDVLTSESITQRKLAARLLTILPGKRAAQGLVSALSDDSAEVVISALRTLSRRKGLDLVKELEPLRKHANTNIGIAATRALHKLRKQDKSWLKELEDDLQSADPLRLICALDLFAESLDPRALPTALSLFASDDWKMRSAAYAYCAAVPHRDAVPALIDRLAVETGRLQGEVHAALVGITGRKYSTATDIWVRWWAAAEADFVAKAPPKKGKKSKPAGDPTPGATTFYGIPVTSNRVCFVLDTSGSMSQTQGTAKVTRLETARRQLGLTVDKLKPEVSMGVVAFSGAAKPWQEGLRYVDSKTKDDAKAFAATFRPGGGTNIHAAMQRAFDYPDVDTIYLLTDGDPSVGEIIDADTLADEIAMWNFSRRITIHTIAIGQNSAFLQRVAEDSGGVYTRR